MLVIPTNGFVSIGRNDKIFLLVISQLSLDIRRQRFGIGSSDTISEQNIVSRIFDLGDDMSSIVSPKITSRLTVFIDYLTRVSVCIVMTVYTIGAIFNIRRSYSHCSFPNFRRSVMILCITLLFIINFHCRNHISFIGFNNLRRISRYTIQIRIHFTNFISLLSVCTTALVLPKSLTKYFVSLL